ncbi:restriction endonuclease [Pontibacter sp. JH31]|uniref:Restriction endonuclease n=1 Tax=Pontibacter aquaedesilientis TaxID=2766980 RepID=A0ABR7XH04_9BACT|nr:restriction endonuclease [Pontibacter aquaedesilientis]MBD1397570.1 restriction endonuclease [Pontibacter aquaedesilientis]
MNTEQCLTEYYKTKGFNIFKSAEYAQSNILNFVEFANRNILEAKKSNTSFLFSNVTKDIVEVNTEYYIIKEIHKKLLAMEWRDFEFLSSTILEFCFGAFDVKTSQASSDGGVDFEGKLPVYSTLAKDLYGIIEVYGQSKKYTGNVGIYDIKSFVAFANSKKRNYVHPAQLFMYFTTSDFANNSVKELAENGFIGLSGFQLATLIYKHKQILTDKSEIINEIIN